MVTWIQLIEYEKNGCFELLSEHKIKTQNKTKCLKNFFKFFLNNEELAILDLNTYVR